LAGRIVGQVLLERKARLTRRRRWPVVAAAAALLLAPLLGLLWLRQPEPVPSLVVPSPVVVVKPKEVEPDVKPKPKAEPLRPRLEETRLALEGVTDRLMRVNLQPARLVQTVSLPLDMAPLGTLTHMEPLNQPLGGATQGVRHAGQGMNLGVATVTGTTRRAMSYFLRDLPPLAAPKKGAL
jgi:hypothetical protein